MVPEYEEVEDCSNQDPCIVVQRCCWWHRSCSTQQDWKVDEWDPGFVRENLMEKPYYNRPNCSPKKEPVHSLIVPRGSKDSSWPHQTPYYRCIKEDSIPRACPRAVWRKQLVLAYVGDRCQQPPCYSDVYGSGKNCPNELYQQK